MPNYGGAHEDEFARAERIAMEEIDIQFNHWFNQAQPLEAITKELRKTTTHLIPAEARIIKAQIKHAFTHGYARGVAAEVAKQED